MGWYRIFPTRDTFVTNAHPANDLSIRATGSNLGASPTLNVFARKGDMFTGSLELARTLVSFNVSELSGLIYSEQRIPSSSVSYVLKMSEHIHDDTSPTSFTLQVYPLSSSWNEGTGIDVDNFEDTGYVNWLDSTSTTSWVNSGSDYLTTYGSGAVDFDRGNGDFEVDITNIVVNWLTGAIANNGLVIKLSDTNENNNINYYRKAFHSRETQFVDKIPYIEARWNSVQKDNRNNASFDIANKLYLYNIVRGTPTDATQPVVVEIKNNLVSASASFHTFFTASRVETGVYSASFTISSTGSYSGSNTFYDIWTHNGTQLLRSGSFVLSYATGSIVNVYDDYVVNVDNLKALYTEDEETRLFVNVRKKYLRTFSGLLKSASLNTDREYVENMYYSVVNRETGETVIPFGTGSTRHTQLSYDGSGNYMDLWMKSFVAGFQYEILFLIQFNKNEKKILRDMYTFKVV